MMFWKHIRGLCDTALVIIRSRIHPRMMFRFRGTIGGSLGGTLGAGGSQRVSFGPRGVLFWASGLFFDLGGLNKSGPRLNSYKILFNTCIYEILYDENRYKSH